jgi:cytochrome c-type biogenesis protein CcmE
VRSVRSPARLLVALSISGVLALFLIYTAVAGSGTLTIKPSQLAAHPGKVQIVGNVVGPIDGDPYGSAGQRFRMQDIGGRATVEVVYRGDEGPLFKVGSPILVTGEVRDGTFFAQRDSMLTKCPSKYLPQKSA